MSKQYPYLFVFANVITLLVVLVSCLDPGLLYRYEFGIAGLMILMLGMPHGATDYLIYRQLSLSTRENAIVFIFYYVLLMLLYGLLWVYVPVIALIVFLLLSVYHFGQSNWENLLAETSKIERVFASFLWGAFVLAWPLLLDQQKTISILEPVLGVELGLLSSGFVNAMLISLLALNVVWLVSAYVRQVVDGKVLIGELSNLLILCVLFLFTPLLVGFAVYFAFWHSLSSIKDQIKFFRHRIPNYRGLDYVKDALPFSVVALLGLFAWLMLQSNAMTLSTVNMGWLFAFVAMLTLPHMLLIERLFEEVRLVK